MQTKTLEITNGSVSTPIGFRAAGVHASIKQTGPDLALIMSDTPCAVAAMFTTNQVPAHCINLNKSKITSGVGQAIVINSGNANACTGEQGRLDAIEMAERTAAGLSLTPDLVYVANTGIIGSQLPMDLVRRGIDKACCSLTPQGGVDAAWAIMTTDTRPKHFSLQFDLGDSTCTIGVIAKGSGMINPNMATMICVFTTDVAINQEMLREALKETVDVSLNMLTVDGEMSTNDCVFLFANGAAGNQEITSKDKLYRQFRDALRQLAIAMTKEIALDGEGATKLVIVTVDGAKSHQDAVEAAKSIANSNLVKTAIFGMDPNWGRVVQAIGASGAQVNLDTFSIRFADIPVAENGGRIEYDSLAMHVALQNKEIPIHADLGCGSSSATVYTCDLTHDYITINADYHT